MKEVGGGEGERATPPARQTPVAALTQLVRGWNAGHFGRAVSGRGKEDYKILLEATGGRLLIRGHPALSGAVKISRWLSVTQCLLRSILSHASCAKARPMVIRDLLERDAIISGGGLAPLLPHPDAISDILKRITSGPSFKEMLASMRLAVGFIGAEYTDIRLDGTVNVIQSSLGDVP